MGLPTFNGFSRTSVLLGIIIFLLIGVLASQFALYDTVNKLADFSEQAAVAKVQPAVAIPTVEASPSATIEPSPTVAKKRPVVTNTPVASPTDAQ